MSDLTPANEAAIRYIATRGIFPDNSQYPGGSLAALQQIIAELDRTRAEQATGKKCEQIIRAIVDLSNARLDAGERGWAISIGPDWGGSSLTIERPELGHTHVGQFWERGTFEALVDDLHAQLTRGGGLSWVVSKSSQPATDAILPASSPSPTEDGRVSSEAATAAVGASLIPRETERPHCGCPADGSLHLVTCPTMLGDIERMKAQGMES